MRRSPLRTVRADLPHTALQSVVCSLSETGSFRWLIPRGNCHGWLFTVHRPGLSTFLPPFTPPVVTRLRTMVPVFPASDFPRVACATMAALTAARLRSRGFLPGQLSMLPHDTFPAFSPQPPPTARSLTMDEGCRSDRSPLLRQASPFPGRLAAVEGRDDSGKENDAPSGHALPFFATRCRHFARSTLFHSSFNLSQSQGHGAPSGRALPFFATRCRRGASEKAILKQRTKNKEQRTKNKEPSPPLPR